jgi:hypothetical protein
MDEAELGSWLEAYGRAWKERDPDAAPRLFAEDASYRETPFDAPRSPDGKGFEPTGGADER